MDDREQLLDLIEKNKDDTLSLLQLAHLVEYEKDGFSFIVKNKLLNATHGYKPSSYEIHTASIKEVCVRYFRNYFYVYLKLKAKE
jgi:hypothetical protein